MSARRLAPQSDNTVSLLQLYRLFWQGGREQYLEMADTDPTMRRLAAEFEREDARIRAKHELGTAKRRRVGKYFV
jgi:hypothetical protein